MAFKGAANNYSPIKILWKEIKLSQAVHFKIFHFQAFEKETNNKATSRKQLQTIALLAFQKKLPPFE